MQFKNVSVYNIENAVRGMRNPLMSHGKSDTTEGFYWHYDGTYAPANPTPDSSHGSWIPRLGQSDYDLATRLIAAGEPHRKFLRQIFVSADILKMPAYLLHEFATYKVGTTLDCSSTMHRIMSRPLSKDDFEAPETDLENIVLGDTIHALNETRENYLAAKSEGNSANCERIFRSMKRMLPHGYLYEIMTWTANYETLANIWSWRHAHRLPAWHEFCQQLIEKLPYSEFITQEA